jgi:hypothetical protein
VADIPKPSAYTPVRRWFTDEKKREYRETWDLYQTLKVQHYSLGLERLGFASAVFKRICEQAPIPDEMMDPFVEAFLHIVSAESAIFDMP